MILQTAETAHLGEVTEVMASVGNIAAIKIMAKNHMETFYGDARIILKMFLCGVRLDWLLTQKITSGMMWETINTAPKNGAKIIARDAEGTHRLTWFEMGDWYYRGWRENSDQEEFEFDELWNPVEWMTIK